jgi:hypothetical protein
MLPNQGLVDEADAVMQLPENVRPQQGLPAKSGDFLGAYWPPGTSASSSITSKAPQLPLQGNAQSMSKGGDGTSQREALTPVDGSPTAGFEFAPAPSFHVGVGGLATTSLGLQPWDRRRKRSVDVGVFVDEEFRSGSSRGQHVEDERARARQAVEASRLPANLAVVPTPSRAAAEVDVEMEDIVEDNTENRPPQDLPSPPTNPGALDAAMERLALKDLVLEVPPGLEEHPESDIESSSGSESQENQNLADLLADRIHNNVEGRYDFEIFCDPA